MELIWNGKKEMIESINLDTNKKLVLDIESSKDIENTGNLYIEGDNLDVLKLLQNEYESKVKMIYIDPPYNTGKKFIYNDKFNTHDNWLNMMYPRLVLARKLLKDDGVIFISIDDNEQSNLKLICDEIFGESNFVANLVWANKEGGGSSDSRLFRIKHEYILVYSKVIENIDILGLEIGNVERYKESDEFIETRGKYYFQKLGMGSIQYSKSLDYPIKAPDNTIIMPSDNNKGRKACWRWSRKKFEWGIENGFIEIKKNSNDIWTVYTKQYINCDNDGVIISRTQRPMGIIDGFSSTQASKFMKSIELGTYFNYSKPFNLITYLLNRINLSKNDIILDFFSGSSTTAHAVMKLNNEDNGNRKFIMVQLPEETYEKSEAYKSGYKNICEIGKERIRRAGDMILEENKDKEDIQNLDVGFKVFKVEDNM